LGFVCLSHSDGWKSISLEIFGQAGREIKGGLQTGQMKSAQDPLKDA